MGGPARRQRDRRPRRRAGRAYQAFQQAGFGTVKLAGVPIHDAGWLQDHPELRQRGYARSKPVVAEGQTVTIPLKPPTWSRYELDRQDAARWWRVVDDQGATVPSARWAVDEKLPQLTVRGATPGRGYTVFFCYRAIEFLDPLAPGAWSAARRIWPKRSSRSGACSTRSGSTT
ncbi:MAG: hypothetical protein M5U09_29430 [Gammaproteobacteria bacterium]|nr:hypothetical protein [Gammaproteobacteria bacterium]